ncbi:hypothetical protein NKR23_g12171 [Pleurostoma richardsiae]|uniref:Uncharacterized protein n=1 Tax=Pleurostoma richardsiae TaxID=41990 RepID=A0AA38R6F2_9PEZI|nr:hypothetical protein NKR23_g12171 [Pleurostoma richardsiae]
MATLTEILTCFCGRGIQPPSGAVRCVRPPLILEKPPQPTPRPSYATPARDCDIIVTEVLSILRAAEKHGVWLTRQLDDAVGVEGWTEWIAERVLAGLEAVLKEGREKIGPAMAQAFDSASEAADKVFQFAKDHPVATAGLLTILTVGVLVVLAPVVVEALGFAELGPVEGSFAAWWESTYAGYIPKGSLFSYLQRLGMIWGRS